KDDHTLDLGGKKLIFKVLPYMHWPDTMMEYLPEDKILFSCDGFAAHLAGDSLWNDEQTGDLDWEVRYYFDAIMRPFTGYIRRNLTKLDALDIRMIATSHGPILRTKVRDYIDRYKAWSVDKTEGAQRVAVFYATNYGNTGLIAEEVATQLNKAGFSATLVDITRTSADDMREEIERSIAVVVGTPTFNGDAPKPIWDLLSLFSTVYSLGKKAAAFGSYGWGGEAPRLVLDRLAGLKLKVYPEPLKARLIPSETEIADVKTFVENIAPFFRGADVAEKKPAAV
ncbi:MAG: flavodoxin domain-containing protein, partial [candidate division Zixibacteria bacterium]|nr:flavodoxin domain-containing protein [candidate division Zixibacteria bacterium]